MDPQFEEKYHRLEATHWWFCARRDMVLRLVEKSRPGRDAAILEVGCSAGLLLERLTHAGCQNVTGIDISEAAIARCQSRGMDRTFVMDGAQPAFGDKTFD